MISINDGRAGGAQLCHGEDRRSAVAVNGILAMPGDRRLHSRPPEGAGSGKSGRRVGSFCAPCLEEALERFERNHARILATCEELEHLADGLPALPTNGSHLRLARRLGTMLRDVHAQEEGDVFPLLVSALVAAGIGESIATLTEEHRTDEAFADEVGEVLLEWAAGERHHDAATLGYMMRGLFDNLRRHIAREHDQLVKPIAGLLSGG